MTWPLRAGSAVAAAVVAAAGWLALSAGSAAAEPAVTGVDVQAPANLTVGDHFHYIVRLEAEEGSTLTILPGSLPMAFNVVNTPAAQTTPLGNGRMAVVFDLQIAAFIPGEVAIPPIAIDYTEPSGATGSVLTPPGRVTILSVLPQNQQLSLRDLKPQLEIGTASQFGLFLAIFLAILAALAVVLLLLLRALRSKPATAPEPAVNMGPEDRARAALEAIGAAFNRDRDFVAYYGGLATTTRTYLTERFQFPAYALTTIELAQAMNLQGIDRWQARLVNGLLTQCDAAVYARYTPAMERADHDLTAAFEIVEMSRPGAEPSELGEREVVTVR